MLEPRSKKDSSSSLAGFTLVELLVVVGVIGILVAIAVPNFTRFRTQAREAEMKNNIKTIHEALQRYSTDSGGIYPPWINGGDWTDSFNLPEDPNDEVDLAQNFFGKSFSKVFSNSGLEQPPQWVDRAGPGDGDALITWGYLDSAGYPSNPFKTGSTQRDQRTGPLGAMTINQTSGSVTTERAVGGFQNTLMWEISGGPPQTGLPTGDGSVRGHPGWKFLFPTVPHDPNTNEIQQSRTGSGTSLHLPGNFYYYAIPRKTGGVDGWYDYRHSDTSGSGGSPLMSEAENQSNAPVTVDRYYLVGYGGNLSPDNTKTDFYDNFGEFPIHVRTDQPGGGSAIEPVNTGRGGPDGIGDGAVILLTGGGVQRPPSE